MPPPRAGTIIYDGSCELCRSSLCWLDRHSRRSLARKPSALDSPDEVQYVLPDGSILGGAAAVSAILQDSGHPVLASLVRSSGPLGRWTYRLIARHRMLA